MGGQSGNTTQRTEPPRYQLPYLQDSLQFAQDQYATRPGIHNVAPMSQQSSAALSGIEQRAGGNPITGAQQDLATRTLQGGFLGSNPYLDQTFNQAALATQNQLGSEFARSGRNIEASEGLRGQQLNQLATGIYGGAYDAERNRQNQVLGMSPALQQGAYADLDRLAQTGQVREGYQQQQLDAPGRALDDYIRRISGNMGQTTVQTGGGNNPWAGAAGGAMAGAQMGSMFGPWGMGIGALGGGLLGAFG